MTHLKENVVIITGASSGIGREMALQLAEQGAWLVLAARDKALLEEIKGECEKRGGRAIAVQTDVADPAQCKALIAQTVAAYGRIDTLINNAGIGMVVKFEEVEDLSIFEKIMKVNYLGSVYCTHYALPYLKRSKGRLVAISSLTGKTGVPFRTGYAASKSAMAGFFDSLRIELKPSSVSVTVIFPGYIATEFRAKALDGTGKKVGKEPIVKKGKMSPEECARICIQAIAKRKREEIMTLRGKLGMWVKLIAPNYIDYLAEKSTRA